MLILALAAASSHLNLLGLSGMVVGGSQAKLDLHLADLLSTFDFGALGLTPNLCGRVSRRPPKLHWVWYHWD
ncbi:hypothetical protein N7471_000374 [Penicillium samsonianum]|uniref:uncharacterized protein n=1 Tax=Penicillium samsonianum TaxID=1882272 RepID=UPI002548DB3D|nr:uncharacterized protein N7471_000374 [Penicillium samsonianum]KAJ6149175.1 hypothetical protein N7471_000374 [Penicillium samsonianum]